MARSVKAHPTVAAGDGPLGIMLPGLGAVATTFIAGVMAVRRDLAKPIGSLTQLQTIRLGARSENRSPLIRDFLPLSDLEDLPLCRLGSAWRKRFASSPPLASARKLDA